MEINWNTKEGELDVKFYYPHIDLMGFKGQPTSSSIVISNAIRKNLKGTKINWTNGSSTEESNLYSSVLTLKFRVGKYYEKEKITLKKVNDILYNLDKDIQTEIRKLINHNQK